MLNRNPLHTVCLGLLLAAVPFTVGADPLGSSAKKVALRPKVASINAGRRRAMDLGQVVSQRPVIKKAPETGGKTNDGDTRPTLASREELLKQLREQQAKLAEDKQALSKATLRHDGVATKSARERIKADGQAIFQTQQKLHAVKLAKK